MNVGLAFTRIFFLILSVFFMTTYMISAKGGIFGIHVLTGVGIGLLFSMLLILFDNFFKRFNLRAFNIVIVGIFIGYLMGKGLVIVLNTILDISAASFLLHPQILEIIQIAIFLFGIYLGTIMTLRSSDELYVSIPFIRFTPTAHKKKDILLDISALADSRIIDLAISGLLDQSLIIPRFVIKELYIQAEAKDELNKSRAKLSLDTLKKLEEIPSLNVRYNDTDFPDVKDIFSKLTRLAKLLDANILTADASKLRMETIEGVKLINMHFLSKSLKPHMQAGEVLKIKIQRYGKEPNQGIGYLDDGTMVVVNGGGDYIGQLIDVQVLSEKSTTSGRMIFCNAYDVEEEKHE
ncbi:MAG: hypothetical protein AMS24_00980 [Chlamydiae bacterium SM23_39]|nr:MAG: hypothetical protein AMS24_00980 [Chlamydiae bacterium SM23_39]